MTLTILGAVVIPLVLWFVGHGERLLQLVLVASVFEAGAIAVLGGFGLQPGLLPELAFLAHVGAQYLLGMRYRGEAAVLVTLAPLLLLLGYAVLSALFLPEVYAGKVIVWPQKPDLLRPEPVPLAPSAGNMTQTAYLAVNIIFCVAVAVFLTRSHTRGWQAILKAYLGSGYLVVALAFWQFAHRVAGVPFTKEVLYSNPGWTVVEQSLGPVPRIQGPFTEPAGLAFYMTGVAFCCLWLCLRGHRTMRPHWLLLLAILATCLSTSTTGIATLAVGLPAALAMGAVRADALGLRRATTALGTVLGAGMMALVPLLLLRPELLDLLDLVLDSTLEKGGSDSFAERQMLDGLAWNAVAESWGLGIGWGSTRASSFVPGLLAGGGVFSGLMVLALFFGLRRLGRLAKSRDSCHDPAAPIMHGFGAALAGQLLAALLSAPMIVSPIFYLQLGAVTAALVRSGMGMVTSRRGRPDGPLAARGTWGHTGDPDPLPQTPPDQDKAVPRQVATGSPLRSGIG